MTIRYTSPIPVPAMDRALATKPMESRGFLSDVLQHGLREASLRKQYTNDLHEERRAGRKEVEIHKIGLQVTAEKLCNQVAFVEFTSEVEQQNLDNFSRVVTAAHNQNQATVTSLVQSADQYTRELQSKVENGLQEPWARFLAEHCIDRTQKLVKQIDTTYDDFTTFLGDSMKSAISRSGT